VTAEYASKQLGDTTIFSKTFQDFPGKRSDNTRYAEQKRALMHASEIRQIARHSEVLIVSDTAPPIRAAFPPLAVMRNAFAARRKGSPRDIHLGDIDTAFLLTETTDTKNSLEESNGRFMNIISTEVDRVFTDDTVIELLTPDRDIANPEQLPGVESVEEHDETIRSASDHAAALNDLTADLRLKLAGNYERILLNIR